MTLIITPSAPTSSKYVLQTADSVLPNAQALGSLSSGIMKVTTTTGAVTSATAPTGTVVGDTDTQTLSSKTLTSPLFQGSWDGWISANEVWSYASASTITVPSGAASKYQKGDRIKWTQTTVKYGVIVAVADTLLTIAVNSDYVVTNAAISANYYSHSDNPIGYPDWFNFVPTFGGFSSNPTGYICKYRINGSTCTFWYSDRNASQGTSNATNFTITCPVTPAHNNETMGFCSVYDNSGWTGNTGKVKSGTSSTTLSAFPTMSEGGWTAANLKLIETICTIKF